MADAAPGQIRLGTPAGRWLLVGTILGTAVVFIDSTVVNVALPSIQDDLGGGVSGLQWTIDAYLLALSALILVGGSLADLYGRRRMYVIGLIGFGIASLLCGLAPNIGTLIAARALQGVAGALLVPGSLAILEASFHPKDRSTAIGAWTGFGGIGPALGPFIGGWLVDAASWRWVFLVNLPFVLAAVWVAIRHVPESRGHGDVTRLDVPGSITGALGLVGVVFALIEGPVRGWTDPVVLMAAVLGVVLLGAFLAIEARSPIAMLPLRIFRSKTFSGVNATTVAVYGALGGVFFLLIIQLQESMGYSALEAGVASLPVTLIMLVLSPRVGRLLTRVGPKWPMTVGPLVIACGLLLMTRIEPGSTYATSVLPAIVVFGLGLSCTVAPLTATALAAVDSEHSGLASGVNNLAARVAQLLAVALLPFAAGLTGDDVDFTEGFHKAMYISAAMTVVGALIAFLTVPSAPLQGSDEAEGVDGDAVPVEGAEGAEPNRVPCPPGLPGCPPLDVQVPAGTG
jgi:EmrB/QacA subfamily drug resistance transporter